MRKMYVAAFALPFVIAAFGAALTTHGGNALPSLQSGGTKAKPQVRQPPDSSTTEIAVIYIGSATCKWSNLPSMPAIVQEITDSVSQYAEATGYSFATHGIAKDTDPVAGVEHLVRIAPFDEISSGRAWMGSGVLKYIFSAHPGPAATPQIVIVRRDVYIEAGDRDIREERVLRRLVSAAEMQNWLANGAFLPVGESAVVRSP